MFSIYSDREDNLQRFDKEIIVDVKCASAVLRGAHIYASGILGMSAGELFKRTSLTVSTFDLK